MIGVEDIPYYYFKLINSYYSYLDNIYKCVYMFVNTVVLVGVKTITISLEAYEALLRVKKSGESFSDVILRLVRKYKSVMDYAGLWKDVSDEEVNKIFEEVRGVWSRWDTRLVESS